MACNSPAKLSVNAKASGYRHLQMVFGLRVGRTGEADCL